tara:strand:+ start:597 stop:1091 length:495 start_codon:yes stop_codon:yes gene_type:complete
MGLFKKKDGTNTGFKSFISKIGGIIPEVLEVGSEIASGDLFGAISKTKEILKKQSANNEKASIALLELEKHENQWKLDAFNSELKDREGARELYKKDNSLQKVYAITFLLFYALMTFVMFYGVYVVILNESKIDNVIVGLITSTYTGMSMKVGTITDFLFGGSV